MDEASADDASTYVFSISGASADAYHLDDTALLSGDIVNSIDVIWRAMRTGGTATGRAGVRLGIASLYASSRSVTTSFANYEEADLNRPGGGAWQQSDLNSLQGIIELGTALRCTQVYIEVNYTAQDIQTPVDNVQVAITDAVVVVAGQSASAIDAGTVGLTENALIETIEIYAQSDGATIGLGEETPTIEDSALALESAAIGLIESLSGFETTVATEVPDWTFDDPFGGFAWQATAVTTEDLPIALTESVALIDNTFAVVQDDAGLAIADVASKADEVGQRPNIPDVPNLWAVIYDASDDPIGLLPHIFEGSIEYAINELGAFSVTIPAGDRPTNLYRGLQIGIWDTRYGEVFRGIVRDIESMTREDALVLQVTGVSMADELDRRHTLFGQWSEAETFSAAATKLLAGSGWTHTGFSTSLTIEQRWDNMTVWAALVQLAGTQGGFIRETAILRQVQFVATAPSSNITLVNPETVGVSELGEDIGIIEGVDRVREEGSAIVNRIIPYGRSEGMDRPFDLFLSQRTAPYTKTRIEPELPPKVIAWADSGAISNKKDDIIVELQVGAAPNLSLVAFFIYEGTDAFSPYHAMYANGTPMTISMGQTLQGRHVTHFSLPIDAGHWKLNGQVNQGPEVNTRCILVALSNVYTNWASASFPQRSIYTINFNSGSSSTISITGSNNAIELTNEDGLALVFAGRSAGNLNTGNDFAAVFDNQNTGPRTLAATKLGRGNVAFSFNLSASAQWAATALSIRPWRYYALEDAASISTYGPITRPLIEPSIRNSGSNNLSQRQAAADTLYDWAAYNLTHRKDPLRVYELNIAAIGRRDWLVGDTMSVIYVQPELQLNDTLVTVRRSETFASDGRHEWHIAFTSFAAFPVNDTAFLAERLRQLSGLFRPE